MNEIVKILKFSHSYKIGTKEHEKPITLVHYETVLEPGKPFVATLEGHLTNPDEIAEKVAKGMVKK